jgi:prepilin-type processing-associated H-X9-DG protein
MGPNQKACATLIPSYLCPSFPHTRQVNNQNILNRVQASYLGSSGSWSATDTLGQLTAVLGPVIPNERITQSHLRQNGVLFMIDGTIPNKKKGYGLIGIDFSAITNGLSNVIIVGEVAGDSTFSNNGNANDHWYIGMPQSEGNFAPPGYSATYVGNDAQGHYSTAGSEFSETVGSGYTIINNRWKNPTTDMRLNQLCFGSYHPGGASFLHCDGSVFYMNDAIDLGVYRNLFNRGL